MKFKTILAALMITVIVVPQISLADTALKSTNTTVAIVKATASSTGTSSSTSTVPADTMAISTVAIPFDQNLTFKTFIKEFKLKSNTPKETLVKAEKLFNLYKSQVKAHKDEQAMKAFDQMMDLLAPHVGVEMFKAVECVPASPVTVTQ